MGKKEQFPGQSVFVPWLVCMDTKQDAVSECNKEVGVKDDDVNSCLQSDQANAMLKKYVHDGEVAKIRGTPSVFVNGVQLQKRTYDDVKDALCAADNGLSACSSSILV